MRGQRLRNASLDVLGQPAPTGACGRHICSSTTGVCASVWAYRRGLGSACVGMRGRAWAHTKGTEGVRCGVPAAERDTAAATIGRYTRPASDRHTALNRCIVQLWRTRVDHAHGDVARAHLICVLDQLDRVSSEPPIGRSTRLVPASSSCAVGPSGHLHVNMMSWLDIVDQRLIWPGTAWTRTGRVEARAWPPRQLHHVSLVEVEAPWLNS